VTLPPQSRGAPLAITLFSPDSLQPVQLTEQGKEDAAQTLSNLSQTPFSQPPPTQTLSYTAVAGIPGINDPGPSSHPRGPPNLGQLSAVAMQAAPATLVPGQIPPQQPQHPHPMPQHEDGGTEDEGVGGQDGQSGSPGAGTTPGTTGRRGARSAAMGTDEWTRQRKDNHKEVERRRRGNINEGINELGRIVPNGNGEKAKGAILARAVQYIHHLKENEARNIEKWTLEKLLMDQAMSDLQAQLEEMKRLWDEERMARQRAESELELLRGMHGIKADVETGGKRRNEEGETGVGDGDGERDGKRARTTE